MIYMEAICAEKFALNFGRLRKGCDRYGQQKEAVGRLSQASESTFG